MPMIPVLPEFMVHGLTDWPMAPMCKTHGLVVLSVRAARQGLTSALPSYPLVCVL